MVKRKRRNRISKPKEEIVEEPIKGGETESEDYCFVCKDGGLLMVCDYKGCVKSYHAECVGKEESAEDNDDPLICGWHKCLVCERTPKYHCFCCPNAVCQSCFKDAAFAKTRSCRGFCQDCVKLAMLGEEGVDVDSDGENVDFKDRETYEGLFKEYWDIVKEKEGLTLDDLHDADIQIKKDDDRDKPHKSHKSRASRQLHHSDSDESVKEEENRELTSDDDHDSDGDGDGVTVVQPVIVKNKKPKQLPRRRKGPKKIEFIGWASKVLIDFLASIEVDTSKKLSQDDVASLVHKYVQENKLFDPDKKKKVLCDVRLRPLIGRNSISMYKINDALECHFSENLEKSEGEGYSSGYEEDKASLPTKKPGWWRKLGSFQHKGSLIGKFEQKEAIFEEPKKINAAPKVIYSKFATITPQNMKLVYLKRCLVEKMLEQRETFEDKVVGSFVKVKSEPFDARRPYQLLPVKGIQKSDDKNNGKVFLQVSNLPNDVPIRLLSNDDIAEEDCEGLRQKVDSGLLPKPTVVELDKKAKEIHEDITKYWIARELSILKNRIDLANEKGRRAELFESRQKRDLLQSEAEQSRLLNEVPQVIADVIEVMPESEETQHNDGSGNVSTQVNPGEISEGNGNIPA